MKKLLLLNVLLGMNAILAMKAPEPLELEPQDIILVSAEGKEFSLPQSAVMRCKQLACLMQSDFQEKTSHRLDITTVSAQTLKILIPLLKRLDLLLLFNEKVAQSNPEKQLYIPRLFQHHRVNKRLSEVSNREIVALYQAADFLDVPFIINGVAAVIADRIKGKINTEQWEKWNMQERESFINQKAAYLGIHMKQEYILKHVTLRKVGITQEYSIADYIAEHGQPQLNERTKLDLSDKNLTSLFGIDRLHARALCLRLDLSENCFFDIALDVQSGPMPFQDFAKLELLSLCLNQLNNLPECLFTSLANLRWLYLSHNRLSNLPEHIFAGLVQLQGLDIRGNQLSDQEKEKIEQLANKRFLYFD